MKKVFQFKAIASFVIALLVSSIAWAQKPQSSPRDSVSGKIGKATVSINYGAPSVRGRKIFGGLQPYDKTWRAGANEATTLTTDQAIKVEGKTLPAGKYTLFITPSEKGDWTVTLNSQTGQWGIKNNGEANDDPTKDVVVAKVKPKTAPLTERLKYVITGKGFSMLWENVELPVSVK
ncbi:MAG: hypothetical protein JWR67_1574 [Mucilaginibacter sp.]|nr:hypothetical protein [Mucilaginibacter sp.]MDB5110460.1 hypothetical protein [Mucilaginibacter sp.]